MYCLDNHISMITVCFLLIIHIFYMGASVSICNELAVSCISGVGNSIACNCFYARQVFKGDIT